MRKPNNPPINSLYFVYSLNRAEGFSLCVTYTHRGVAVKSLNFSYFLFFFASTPDPDPFVFELPYTFSEPERKWRLRKMRKASQQMPAMTTMYSA